MHRTYFSLAITLVLALGISACGSSTSTTPNEEVREVANKFSAAFGSGDIKKACSYWLPGEDVSRPGTCLRVYEGGLDASEFQTFLTAKVQRVAISGKVATVAYSNEWIAKLKKLDSGWAMNELGLGKYYAGLEEEEGEEEFEREWKEILKEESEK